MGSAYYRNMPYSDGADDEATAWFAARRIEQARAHEGATLGSLAAAVLSELPSGPLALVSLSVEGCALSAVVAALRPEATTWEQINLGRIRLDPDLPVVLVEPVQIAPGLLKWIKVHLPQATIVQPVGSTGTGLAAAA